MFNFEKDDLIAKNAEFSDKCEFHKDLKLSANDRIETTLGFLQEEFLETHEALDAIKAASKNYEYVSNDMIKELIDGFADCSVISLNGLYKIGRNLLLNHQQSVIFTKMCFNAVLESNLTKINEAGEVIFKNGKVQKPDTYRKPDFSKAFEYVELRKKELFEELKPI